jgi:hypothetical protein
LNLGSATSKECFFIAFEIKTYTKIGSLRVKARKLLDVPSIGEDLALLIASL